MLLDNRLSYLQEAISIVYICQLGAEKSISRSLKLDQPGCGFFRGFLEVKLSCWKHFLLIYDGPKGFEHLRLFEFKR